MKELESEKVPTKVQAGKISSDEDAIMVDSPATTEKGSIRKKKSKK